ncbi:MAG: hypothetical protein ACXW4T_04995 [Candidatus Limnocylindrales bacterium]
MTFGATLVASFLIALSRPITWPLGLVGLLIRGGLVLLVTPIVVLPTPVGLANVVAPLIEDVAFGRRPAELAALVLATGGVVLAWLIGGGIIAAAAERELVRAVAADDELAIEGVARPIPDIAGRAWRVVVVRLIAHLPLLLALAWGAIRLVSVAYREFTLPSDVTLPVAVRVLAGAPDAVAAIGLAWLLGETFGALAARRVVLLGEGVPRALRGGLARFLRHPARVLAFNALTTVVLAAVIALTAVATNTVWDASRVALALGEDPFGPVVLVLALGGLFGSGSVVIALLTTWRSALWTVDLAGTFGAGHGARPGD